LVQNIWRNGNTE